MQELGQRSNVRTSLALLVLIGMGVLPGIVPVLCQEQQAFAGPIGSTHSTSDSSNTGGAVKPSQNALVLQERNPRYRLCQGDVFDLSFPLTSEFNQTITVQPDGYITLAGVGDVYVAGKTVPALTEVVRAGYKGILHDPIINIVVREFDKPYFIAAGEVARPGKYDLRDDVTLTEAIAMAGGFTQNSKHSEVSVFRRVSNNWVQVNTFDVKKMFKVGNLAEDLHLQPGDMFFVPQNRISKISKYIPNSGVGVTLNPY